MSIYPVCGYALICNECGDDLVDEDGDQVVERSHSRLLNLAAEWGWGADPAIADRGTCPDCRVIGCARMSHNYTPWHPADPVDGYPTEQRCCRYCVRTEARAATLTIPGIPGHERARA